jgi:hypothetical protein
VTRRHAIVRLGFVCGLTFALLGCQPGPEIFPQRFDAAAGQGLEGILPLLTRSSRAAVEALGQSKGAQPNPFLPSKVAQPTKVLAVRAIEGGVVLQVSTSDPDTPGDSRKSEWVLRQEDGGWRLDVLATANRRPLP